MLRKLPLPKKLGLLENIYGETLESAGISWVKCRNGARWKLDLEDPTHRWIVYGEYEGGTGIRYAMKALENGGVFVDSGANIGQWILYLGSLPGVQALEFEPVSSQRHWLEECVHAQKSWNCQVLPYGLGSSDSTIDIQVNGARSTLRSDWYTTSNCPKENIAIRRLDTLLEARGISCVQLWKLDVEGAEYDALIGATGYLKKQLIKNIFLECHPSNYAKTKELLNHHNYDLYDLTEMGIRPKNDSRINSTQDIVAKPRQTHGQS